MKKQILILNQLTANMKQFLQLQEHIKQQVWDQ